MTKQHPASVSLIEQQPGCQMWRLEKWRITERYTRPDGFARECLVIEDNLPSRSEARQRLNYIRTYTAG